MATLIYFLCAVTALLCTVLLFRGFRRSRVRLLLWSGLCFSFLTLENLLLFLDRTLWAGSDDIPWRGDIPLIGLGLLLYGMIWEDRK
ncbi:MAG: DUF5985 family protein [Verrucomicrobiota bacterium]